MRKTFSPRSSRPSRMAVAGASAQTINVATAGDQNMVDYVKDYLGPMFEKKHPGVKVVAVGTGPGDGGSQKIYEKLDAQKKARRRRMGLRRRRGPPEDRRPDGRGAACSPSTRDQIATGKLVTRDTAANALGADVVGLRHADVPLARRRSPTTPTS